MEADRQQPAHRITSAISWQIPVGRDRHFGSDMPVALDWVVGGWTYTASSRWNSGRPLLFSNSYLVTGDPKLSDPTHEKWFDTSMFTLRRHLHAAHQPLVLDGLNGPDLWVTDMTVTKNFHLADSYRVEARLEAYNAFNHLTGTTPTWPSPTRRSGS